MITRENLSRILDANKKISSSIQTIVKMDLKRLYDESTNIIQNVSLKLEDECIIIRYPIDIDSFGGYVYKTENHKFCFINTNQPRSFQNFVTMHEYYHLNYDEIQSNSIEMILSNEEDSIDLRERRANYYASLMLLDEDSLRKNYYRLAKAKNLNFEEILCYLIDLYKVPKKTILIRLYELECIEDFEQLYINFNNDLEKLKEIFISHGLDISTLEPSNAKKLGNISEAFQEAKELNSMLESFIEQNMAYVDQQLKQLGKFKVNDSK